MLIISASMAPRTESDFSHTVLHKPPTVRKQMGTVDDWLDSKRIDDNAEGLWRIHDKLYDLTPFAHAHPGGSQWLHMTKGTDITEAFEANHISARPDQILHGFFVRDASRPRHSLITFRDSGFYRTLKRKIRQRNLLPETGPLPKTKVFTDGLAVAAFFAGLLGTVGSRWWAVASGVLLNMLAVCAHNFFHMRDNWRMYYFSLLLMSVREWRVSHVLSHHLFPNTLLDLEISSFEPILRFLPKTPKTFRCITFLLCPVVMATMCHFQYARRIALAVVSPKHTLRPEDLLCLSPFLFLLLLGGQGLWRTFVVWNIILVTASFSFALVGLTAAHHHPDIYHEGDFLGADKDFGLLQLAAVRNRADVDGSFAKTMVLFGEHALHHLLPTVDHGRLEALEPVLEETCKEFGISHKPLVARNLVAGMFRQLARNSINGRLLILEK